jgi:hypothetical protein
VFVSFHHCLRWGLAVCACVRAPERADANSGYVGAWARLLCSCCEGRYAARCEAAAVVSCCCVRIGVRMWLWLCTAPRYQCVQQQ